MRLCPHCNATLTYGKISPLWGWDYAKVTCGRCRNCGVLLRLDEDPRARRVLLAIYFIAVLPSLYRRFIDSLPQILTWLLLTISAAIVLYLTWQMVKDFRSPPPPYIAYCEYPRRDYLHEENEEDQKLIATRIEKYKEQQRLRRAAAKWYEFWK